MIAFEKVFYGLIDAYWAGGRRLRVALRAWRWPHAACVEWGTLAWCVCACQRARGAHIATMKKPCPYAMKQQPSITFSATVSPTIHSGTESIALAHNPHAAAAAAASAHDLIDVRHAAARFATAAATRHRGTRVRMVLYDGQRREYTRV